MADELDSELLKASSVQSIHQQFVMLSKSLEGKRGFTQFTRGTMISSDPEGSAHGWFC